MKLLSYLLYLSFTIHVALVFAALSFDRRSALNRAYAISTSFAAVWSLGEVFFYGSDSLQIIGIAYRVSAFGWTLFPPALLYFAFQVCGLPKRRFVRTVVLAPMSALSVLFFGDLLRDRTFLRSVRFTSLGNVGIPVVQSWFLLYFAMAYGTVLAFLALLLISRSRSSSQRYRRMALILLVTYIGTWTLNILMNLFLPPVWRYSALSLTLSDSATLILILRYRFLRLDYALAERDIISAMGDPVVLIDTDLQILKHNEAAERWGMDGKPQGGAIDLLSLFDDPAPVRSAWERAVQERAKSIIEDTSVEGESYLLTVIPCFDRFGDLIGGTIVARRSNLLDSAAVRYGITAREKQIAVKLMLGYSNPEIADHFAISVGTVKTHVHNIYRKTGAVNRVDLVRSFLEDVGGR